MMTPADLVQFRSNKMRWQQQQHLFNGPLSGTTQVSRYQKGKTTLDLLEQEIVSGSGIGMSHMIICTSPQTDNHASTPPYLTLP